MNELVRGDPFRTALPIEGSLFDMVPTLLRPVARQSWAGPRMDISETENAYQLAVELPGVPKDAIQVSVCDNTVTISAEGADEKAQKAEEHDWLLRERTFGKVSRSVTLPETVDDGASQARYSDGVLYLTLQKKRTSKRLTVH